MAPEEHATLTPEDRATLAMFRAMSDALEMVDDALAVARQGLNTNPTKQERRQLDEDILDLALKRTRLTSALIALGRGERTISPPSAQQIARIKELAGEVDQLTRQSVTSSQAVVASGKVLDLVAKSGLA
jgi:hypothetical protein